MIAWVQSPVPPPMVKMQYNIALRISSVSFYENTLGIISSNIGSLIFISNIFQAHVNMKNHNKIFENKNY